MGVVIKAIVASCNSKGFLVTKHVGKLGKNL